MTVSNETICAVATPAGRGGISIIRVSGSDSSRIAKNIAGHLPPPRYAHYGNFLASSGDTIDSGITLFFPGPDSFTGEDVIELQAHGGPFVVDILLQEILSMGVRLARPGEFSERAFLNDKIDLAQAEAIADLIESNSAEAARFAVRSLQGEFSALVNSLINAIVELRMYVEAAMDFPEEEVDFLEEGDVENRLQQLLKQMDGVLAQARQGTIMKDGLKVVIAGEPNAGKSSLLNVLAGQSRAIVTEIAGTTRDILKEHISIDGMGLHIIDTAGLHVSEDIVEQEGIRRAWQEIGEADLVLLVIDASKEFDLEHFELFTEIQTLIPEPENLFLVFNKIDIAKTSARLEIGNESLPTSIYLSAKNMQGIDLLTSALKTHAGLNTTTEGGFIARRRHLDALEKSRSFLISALAQLVSSKAGELVAEDLREAHQCLELITGRYTPDDLLGEIFSSFCIGK